MRRAHNWGKRSKQPISEASVELRADIERRVKQVIKDELGFDNVRPITNLKKLGLDSLDHVELWIALEEEFEIDIPDAELDMFKTVQDMINCVERYLAHG